MVDVANPVKVGIWAAKVLGFGEAPDLLINNAAIMNRLAKTWEFDDREFTKLVDVNIRGYFFAVSENRRLKGELQEMRRQAASSIVVPQGPVG